MTTASTLISDALEDLGHLDPGESLAAADGASALRRLNRLISSWSAHGLLIPYHTRINWDTIASTVSYTFGSGGTGSTTRPRKFVSAFIRDSGSTDHAVRIIGEKEYNAHPSKSTTSRPYSLWYKPSYTLGYAYLYPTPSAAETLYADVEADLHATLALTDTVSLDGMYERFIVSRLAIACAPSFRAEPSLATIDEAERAYNAIISLNLANRLEPVGMPAGVVGVSGGSYDIDEG
jgi:hypothetical protein